LFLLYDKFLAISLAASILLKSIYAGESLIAAPKSSAALASPSALIMIALFSCSAL